METLVNIHNGVCMSVYFYLKCVNMRKTSSAWTEHDMQNAINTFREGRSQCYAVELFGVPHLYLQRFLRTGQDIPLKNKDRRTMFSSEQD